jgi:predicted nucleotidyltransferase
MAFSTYILDEVLKKQKEQSELARCEIIQKIHGLLIELQKKYLFKEAYLFGSILNSNAFAKWSDIDIAFEGLADEYFFPVYGGIIP